MDQLRSCCAKERLRIFYAGSRARPPWRSLPQLQRPLKRRSGFVSLRGRKLRPSPSGPLPAGGGGSRAAPGGCRSLFALSRIAARPPRFVLGCRSAVRPFPSVSAGVCGLRALVPLPAAQQRFAHQSSRPGPKRFCEFPKKEFAPQTGGRFYERPLGSFTAYSHRSS